MKHLINWKVFESITTQNQITIEEYLDSIGINSRRKPQIIDWWNQNRSHIKIYQFQFRTNQPIAGVFLGEDTIALNQRTPMPPHVRLFLALHESRHCDQQREGQFMSRYYQTVVDGDKEAFLAGYAELEADANDFAIDAMRQCGFNQEMDREANRLKSNESAGPMVYQMMSRDIAQFNPVDFFDLLKKQIGLN